MVPRIGYDTISDDMFKCHVLYSRTRSSYFHKEVLFIFKVDKKMTISETPKAVLRFERTFLNLYNVAHPPPMSKKGQEALDRVDSILKYVASQDGLPELTLNEWSCDWIMTYIEKPVQINAELDIKIKVDLFEHHSDRVNLKFHLLSNKSSLGVLKNWTNDVYGRFVYDRESTFTGNQLYLFESTSPTDASMSGAQLQLSLDGNVTSEDIQLRRFEQKRQLVSKVRNTPVHCIQRHFNTNKRFRNLFGPSIRRIEQQLHFFQTQELIYHDRGIPYRFGALISGEPGCGKTSVIQAIAAETNRHIVVVNFEHIVTAERLRELFYSDTLYVQSERNGQSTPVNIPVNLRLYVLEDIDALGEIVLARNNDKHGFDSYGSLGVIADELTLSDILNVFDGNLQNEGRVMVVTTNHAYKLDPALIRAGRFNCICDFQPAHKETIIEAFSFFFSHVQDDTMITKSKNLLNELPDTFSVSMADVHAVFFNKFEDPLLAVQSIYERAQKETNQDMQETKKRKVRSK